MKSRIEVFNSGQEHHSNLLPWREAGCEVVSLTELPTGHIEKTWGPLLTIFIMGTPIIREN